MYLCLVGRIEKWGRMEKISVGRVKSPLPHHFLSSLFSPHPDARVMERK